MKNKKLKILLISLITIFLIFILSIKINLFNLNEYYYHYLPMKAKHIIKNINKNISSGHNLFHILNNFFNDYNVKYLPETQLINLNYKTKKIKFDKSFQLTNNKIDYIIKKSDSVQTHFFSFYIEIYQNDLVLADYVGNFYLLDYGELQNSEKKIFPQKINSNLKTDKILDTLIINNELYVSFANKKNNCYNWNISKAKLNKKKLNFINIFSSEECSTQNYYQPHGGRMQPYKHNNLDGILFTVGENKGIKRNDNSIIGKILFLSFDTLEILEFSQGHRNTQGLSVHNNIILSTEHGPRGADEINKIEYNKDYGWPYASYGEPYGKKKIEPELFKEHNKYGFQEPLFAFSKAIGISELIFIPNKFSSFWINNFLISSLWGQSIYRIKFDDSFQKAIFFEKIYIGQRIRDLKYHSTLNAILLALEETGEIAIITNK
jgi:hypothetical protein